MDDYLMDFLKAVYDALADRQQLEIRAYLYGKPEEASEAVEYARLRGFIATKALGSPRDLFVIGMSVEAQNIIRDKRSGYY